MRIIVSNKYNKTACNTWKFCIKRMLRVSEAHTPGCYNQKADAQPRRCTKWKLNPELFYKVIEFGKPHTSLFTSRINSHSEKYCIHHIKTGVHSFLR